MVRIYVTRQSHYPADTKILKKRVGGLLTQRGVVDAEISIALVGVRKIKELARKYLGEENGVHEVLSFPSASLAASSEYRKEAFPPTDTLQLGDVVICYPEARKIAMKKNRMVDDVLGELAEHGTLHLLGIHHEE